VALLRRLGVAGVVAGHNYRFGFRAAGDASALVSLCAAEGLSAHIVEMVTADEAAEQAVADTGAAACALQVSSTRVRGALAAGDVDAAAALLGRRHRFVAICDAAAAHVSSVEAAGSAAALLLPRGAARNQPPKAGLAYALRQQVSLSLRDAAGRVLWHAEQAQAQARGDGDGAAAAALEPLPEGGARLELPQRSGGGGGGWCDAAALQAALAAAPPGATLRVAADV
jgi:hypothetical protein